MTLRNILPAFITLLVSTTALAEQSSIRPFQAGSYRQLLNMQNKQPFMLVIWSITCSSCLKEMELLASLHKNLPALRIVMLSTDDISATDEIQAVIGKYQLTDTENWAFSSENAQQLRFEIDPRWYGELPRTYFFDADHQREGISGVLTSDDYTAHFVKMGL